MLTYLTESLGSLPWHVIHPYRIEFWMGLLPSVFYWLVAGYFDVLDRCQFPATEKYRIRSKAELEKKNSVNKQQVVQRVLLQQAIQLVIAFAMTLSDPQFCEIRPWNGWIHEALQFCLAMLVMDTWQYAIHRLMHEVKFLYNTIHSTHHRLLVCYAYGALYNHPLEAFMLDSLGGVLCMYSTRISCTGGTAFFVFATGKKGHTCYPVCSTATSAAVAILVAAGWGGAGYPHVFQL